MINKQASMKRNRIISLIITYALLIFFSALILIPFYVILITSFKNSNEAAVRIPFKWFPDAADLGLDGYKRLFNSTFRVGNVSYIFVGFVNTMIIMVPTLLVGMFSSSISAYSFAKMRFPGKNIIFSMLLFFMMLPFVVTLVPSYVIFDNIGWVDTLLPLIVPGMFGSVGAVFFLRQFYSGIPDELVEAAKIDGMNYFKIYYKIIIPLSIPALLAQGMLGFLAIYNDFTGPLLYLQSEGNYTLQIALYFFAVGNRTYLHTVMAGSVVTLLPALILYFIMQKSFIEGIAMSGLKA